MGLYSETSLVKMMQLELNEISSVVGGQRPWGLI